MASKNKNTLLLGDEGIVRRCGHQALMRDENNIIVGVALDAFALRVMNGERYLSASWLEYFKGTQSEQLKQTLDTLRKKFSIGPASALLSLKAKEIIECGIARNRRLRVEHRFRTANWNPAYVAVTGLPLQNEDQRLLELLTKVKSIAWHAVKDIDGAAALAAAPAPAQLPADK
jgi:hypothetical protein